MSHTFARLGLAAGIALSAIGLLPAIASAATLAVPGTYATIQDAVNAAISGDTITVSAGTYTGNIIIPTGLLNLTIAGAGPGSTIFNLGSGYGINLDNPPAVVTGFTLSGFTVNSSSGTTYALKAYHANNLTLSNDVFNGAGGGANDGGVDINTTSHVTFNNVTSSGFHKNGFAVTSAYTGADSATPSSDITFNNITATNNGWTGISFYTIGNGGGAANIGGVQFTGTNTVSGNGLGVFLEGDTDPHFGSFATPVYTISGPSNATLNLGTTAFSGNVADDVINYQTAPVSALSATFAGLTGNAMSAGQRTTEDGLIVDQLDHANLGLVTYYTPILSCTDQTSSFSTMSDATETNDSGSPTVATWVHPAWTANIPGAAWIWNHFFVADPTNGETITFTKTINVSGTPTAATITIAADNTYEASMNGVQFGASADANNFEAGTQDTYPVTLHHGANLLSITAHNLAWPTNDPQTNPAGLLYKLDVTQNACVPAPQPGVVHIVKFIDGAHATSDSADGASFPMITPTYGNAPFPLGPNGFLDQGVPYEAATSPIAASGPYAAYEDTSGAVVSAGPSCDGTHPFALVGYSTGSSLAAAQAATPSLTQPAITVDGDQYIIVWNKSCDVTPPIKVHIAKYLDGVPAIGAAANNYLFPMSATWMASNLDGGATTTGSYTLGSGWGTATGYYADTAPMAAPADYITSEIADNTSQVVSSPDLCSPGKYVLNGYHTSAISFADAAVQPLELAPHQFFGLSSDRYVIVDNSTCPTKGSLTVYKNSIGGDGTFTFTGDLGNFTIKTVGGAGSATFDNLTPGAYTVTETNLAKGWTQTDTTCTSVTVSAGGNADCTIVNTNNKLLGAIIGTKYEDRDGDGKLTDGDHHRLSGWTIQLKQGNTVLSTTVTDSRGNYRFLGLVAGTYTVSEVQKAGWIQTYPSSGSYTITLAAGKVSKKDNFGNFKLGSISGMKYEDKNGNGKKDAGENGLSGWTINLKKGNTTASTTVTRADGTYSFTGLTAGVYTLSEGSKLGWVQTDHPGSVLVRSGTSATHEDFGNHNGPIIKKHHYEEDHNSTHHG